MKKNINQIFGKDAHIKIYFLPWLIALSFILRLVTVYFFRDVQIDNEWNILLENLVKDGSYSFYTFEGISIPSVLLPPLYPFFLYSIKTITSLSDNSFLYLIFLIQIILSTYSIFLFYQINQNFFLNKIALINSIIFSIIPLNVYACGQFSSVSIQIFFSLIFLKYLLLIIKKQNIKNITFFSIISGLLILTRGEFILIFSIIIFIFLITKKIKIINLIKIGIIVLLVVSPYLIRNYSHFDKIIIVKSSGYNLWKGNNELSLVEGYENLERPEFRSIHSKIKNLEKNKYYEINRDDIFLDAAIGNLQKDPLRYILLFIKKFLSYYFIDLKSNYPKYYNFFHIFPIFALSLLSLPGLVIFSKINKFENKCLGIYFFLNMIIFSIFFILPRYKLAILPIQIIFLGYFINYIIKKLYKT